MASACVETLLRSDANPRARRSSPQGVSGAQKRHPVQYAKLDFTAKIDAKGDCLVPKFVPSCHPLGGSLHQRSIRIPEAHVSEKGPRNRPDTRCFPPLAKRRSHSDDLVEIWLNAFSNLVEFFLGQKMILPVEGNFLAGVLFIVARN